jgi:5'(3')-deoxyribonucleotidase
MDEVLADLLEAWCDIYNKLYVTSSEQRVTREDINDWHVHNNMPEATKTQVYEILNTPGLFLNLRPIPGAEQAIRLMVQEEHIVTILTAAVSKTAFHEKVAWLERIWPDLDLHKRAIAVSYGPFKGEIADGIGDIIIDDNPHNLVTAKKAIKVLFDAPHNRKEIPEGIIETSSWDDYLNIKLPMIQKTYF